MTTPYERTQAVLRTRELLRSLAAGEPVDIATLKRRCGALLKHFPGSVNLYLSAAANPNV